MKTLKNYALLIPALFLCSLSFGQTPEPAAAEEPKAEEKTFTLSGSVDTYFHSSFGTQNYYPYIYDEFGDPVGPSGAYGPATSFADLKGFSLGMVNFIASYQGEKAGFVADVVFGPRGKAAVFGTASGQAIVNQLYAYYKFTDGFTLNLGQFNTFLGYEVISPAINFHYSTSYLFSWGPFNHTGLRADFAFGDGFVIKAAVMNPTDIVEFNPVNTVTLGAQFGYSNDNGGVWLNVLSGDQDGTLDEDKDADGSVSENGNLFQWDITTSWNFGDKFSLGANISQQTVGDGERMTATGVQDLGLEDRSFMGFALYPKITITDAFALGIRAEYFAVKGGHLGIIGTDGEGDGDVIELTLSANLKAGGLIFIPEFRIDSTSEDSFYTLSEKGATMEPKSMMATVNFAAVYKF